LLLPLAALAAQPSPPSVKADSKDQFNQVADHVPMQMQPGGRFEFLDNGERATVDRDLGEMQSLYAASGSVEAMDEKSKVRLDKDQCEVNAILTRRGAPARRSTEPPVAPTVICSGSMTRI
jgi:hypothetical protein